MQKDRKFGENVFGEKIFPCGEKICSFYDTGFSLNGFKVPFGQNNVAIGENAGFMKMVFCEDLTTFPFLPNL